MRFIRLFWFDMKNGYIKYPFLYLFPAFIASIGFIDVHRQIAVWGREASLGDYWMYLYGGMKEYVPMVGNPFQFPVIWIMVFLLSSFAVLNYPTKDLQSTGTQLLVHVQGRSKWWFSKCLWNIFSTIAYHVTILAVLLLFCICFEVPLTRELHSETIVPMFALGIADFQGGSILPLSVLATPVIFSIAINILQMFLSLLMKPVFSFLLVSMTMLSSAYLLSAGIIGNYAMPIRYQWAMENGVSHRSGLVLSFGILVFSVVFGMIRFRRYDVLNKE